MLCFFAQKFRKIIRCCLEKSRSEWGKFVVTLVAPNVNVTKIAFEPYCEHMLYWLLFRVSNFFENPFITFVFMYIKPKKKKKIGEWNLFFYSLFLSFSVFRHFPGCLISQWIRLKSAKEHRKRTQRERKKKNKESFLCARMKSTLILSLNAVLKHELHDVEIMKGPNEWLKNFWLNLLPFCERIEGKRIISG